ncbi:MAG: hypothetical protein QM658_14980 [Gordonia sp. (in: high G+C Gram-positive bacteria)]
MRNIPDIRQPTRFEKWKLFAECVFAMCSIAAVTLGSIAAYNSSQAARESANAARDTLNGNRPQFAYANIDTQSIPQLGGSNTLLRNSGRSPLWVNGLMLDLHGRQAMIGFESADPKRPPAQLQKSVRSPLLAMSKVELPPGGVEMMVISTKLVSAELQRRRWCEQIDSIAFSFMTGIGFERYDPPRELRTGLTASCRS